MDMRGRSTPCAAVLPAEALRTQRLTPATIAAVPSMQTDYSGEIWVSAISRVRLPTCPGWEYGALGRMPDAYRKTVATQRFA